jgi:hypothetical protein
MWFVLSEITHPSIRVSMPVTPRCKEAIPSHKHACTKMKKIYWRLAYVTSSGWVKVAAIGQSSPWHLHDHDCTRSGNINVDKATLAAIMICCVDESLLRWSRHLQLQQRHWQLIDRRKSSNLQIACDKFAYPWCLEGGSGISCDVCTL